MLSPWGRVVAISALLVVGGIAALVIASFASTSGGAAAVPGRRARVEASTFDVADGDIVIVGGGRRDSVEVQRAGALLVRAPAADREAARAAASFAPPLALSDVAARPVPRLLPRGRARQRRARHPHDVRRRQPARLPRLGPDHHRRGRGSTSPATAATRSTPVRAPARSPSRPTARRRACRCAPRSGAIRAVMPTGRYDLDAESDSGRARARRDRPRRTRRTACRC